jgi:hypothetical protein
MGFEDARKTVGVAFEAYCALSLPPTAPDDQNGDHPGDHQHRKEIVRPEKGIAHEPQKQPRREEPGDDCLQNEPGG